MEFNKSVLINLVKVKDIKLWEFDRNGEKDDFVKSWGWQHDIYHDKIRDIYVVPGFRGETLEFKEISKLDDRMTVDCMKVKYFKGDKGRYPVVKFIKH